MKSIPTPKHFVYNALEAPERRNRLRAVIDTFITVLILLNGVAVTIETVDSLFVQYKTILTVFEYFSVFVFTIEFLLRVWVATDHPEAKYKHPVLGRLRFILTPFSLIDIMAVLPFYLSGFINVDLRFLRVFRLIRIIRFLNYSPSIQALEAVMRKEGHNLTAALLLELLLLFVSSVLMYYIEKDVQPDKFGSIPSAMWWSVAALTTVGFGDVVPITPLGKLLGGVVMIIGIIMFALPAGIMASAFVEEIKGKNFLTTWRLVAKVPFLNQLNAVQIAEIAEKLKPRITLPGEVLFDRGEKSRSMYFIVTGQVEIEIEGESIVLDEGEFFGEMGLLYGRRRTAHVHALTYSELLCLEGKDFFSLLNNHPEIRQTIEGEAEKRKTRRANN